MNLLADENVHGQIVSWLRSRNYDVICAAEELQAIGDAQLLELANVQQRILLTSDKDFGELVFLRGQVATGLILMRLEKLAISARLQILADRWPSIESRASGHFVTLGIRRTRIRPLPGSNR